MPTTLALRRGLLAVSGPDAESFLQGVMTTNLLRLAPAQAAPGLFLNAKGRVAFDVLVYRAARDRLLLDCASSAPLAKYLAMYRLRKKVTVEDLSASHRAVFTTTPPPADALCGFADPRPGMQSTYRAWLPASAVTASSDDALYHHMRMASGIAEGPGEASEETAFVLNCDMWDACLSYEKGCYTGQELVARTHFKGQVRRRIMPCLFDSLGGGLADPLLPAFASAKLGTGSMSGVSVGAEVHALEEAEDETAAAAAAAVGKVIALAPAPRGWLGLVSLRDPWPGAFTGQFAPTHRVGSVKLQAVRPAWWTVSM